MKKKSYKRPAAILVAVIGAYHVVLFGMHPKLPPAEKAEVIWGDLSSEQPARPEPSQIVSAFCSEAQPATNEQKQEPAPTGTVTRVRFEYRPIASTFLNTGDSARVIMARGSSITLGKETYPLKQIRFERMAGNGQRVIHLIHQLKSGKMAVIAVPVQISHEENRIINALWRYLPKQQGEHNSLDDIHIDINKLLPHNRSFYRYPASGACANRVIELGLTAPVQISASQMAKLDKVLGQAENAQPF